MEAKNMMDHSKESMLHEGHLSDLATSMYVDILLKRSNQELPEEVLCHVEGCRECKDAILEVAAFLKNPDIYQELPQKETEPGREKIRPLVRGRIAAIFIAFALVLGVYYLVHQDANMLDTQKDTPTVTSGALEKSTPQNTSKSTAISRSEQNTPVTNGTKIDKNTSRKPKTNQPDPRYTVNPSLENMTGGHLRSSGSEVLSPKNGTIFKAGEPIHFAWSAKLDITHTLKIVSNTNQLVCLYKVKNDAFDFQEPLAPGLYYWKLESTNELIYVGKFYIGTPRKR